MSIGRMSPMPRIHQPQVWFICNGLFNDLNIAYSNRMYALRGDGAGQTLSRPIGPWVAPQCLAWST